MAIPFVVSFLAILFLRRPRISPEVTLIQLVLLGAAAITHLHSAMNPAFFLLGLWVLSRFRANQRTPWSTTSTLLLFFVVPLAWMMLFGPQGFTWLIKGLWLFLVDPWDVIGRLTGIFTVGQANFGASAPQWYSLTLSLIHI